MSQIIPADITLSLNSREMLIKAQQSDQSLISFSVANKSGLKAQVTYFVKWCSD